MNTYPVELSAFLYFCSNIFFFFFLPINFLQIYCYYFPQKSCDWSSTYVFSHSQRASWFYFPSGFPKVVSQRHKHRSFLYNICSSPLVQDILLIHKIPWKSLPCMTIYLGHESWDCWILGLSLEKKKRLFVTGTKARALSFHSRIYSRITKIIYTNSPWFKEVCLPDFKLYHWIWVSKTF